MKPPNLTLNNKINWNLKEFGVIKGILSYYDKDWLAIDEAYLLMMNGIR